MHHTIKTHYLTSFQINDQDSLIHTHKGTTDYHVRNFRGTKVKIYHLIFFLIFIWWLNFFSSFCLIFPYFPISLLCPSIFFLFLVFVHNDYFLFLFYGAGFVVVHRDYGLLCCCCQMIVVEVDGSMVFSMSDIYERVWLVVVATWDYILCCYFVSNRK